MKTRFRSHPDAWREQKSRPPASYIVRVLCDFHMPKKKKPRIRVEKEARRRARAGIGLPPPERTIPNKRDKAEKHKKTLGDLTGAGADI